MKLQRKQKLTLVSMLMMLTQQVHGFYPQYHRHPHRRPQAAGHPYRRRYRTPVRHAAPRAAYDGHHYDRRQGRGKEVVRDLGDRIELYIPCHRQNCNNYDVQLKDDRVHSGTKKIVVTGRQQQRDWYDGQFSHFGRRRPRGGREAPFYENEWLVPANVVEKAITRATTPDGYLKITFPRRGTDADEAPPHGYHEGKESDVPNPQPPPRQQRPSEAAAAEAGNAHGYVRDQEPGVKAASTQADARPEPWRPSPRVLEEEEKWTYPADPGIEIEDVDDSCFDEPEYDVKGKTPSIGYWSREKFVFY